MKKFLNGSIILTMVLCFSMVAPVFAHCSEAIELDAASELLQELATDDAYYSSWEDATLRFGYELLNSDLVSSSASLYYVDKHSSDVGYMIIDNSNYSVLEFSTGTPAHDLYQQKTQDEISPRLYIAAMPAVYLNNEVCYINQSGELLNTNLLLRYTPNEQGNSCIVGAISNLMWYWSDNGYSKLASGMTFQAVESEIKELIKAEGGFANTHIPATIETYVENKDNSYSASVTNVCSPSFHAVRTETNSRPCLLGFAPGSSYSSTLGHMTVCVGTRATNDICYTKLMDGHQTHIVEKQWGSYNDYMAKVVLSK